MMLKGSFKKVVGTSPKIVVATIIVVANAIVWYFYSFSFLMRVMTNNGFSNNLILAIWAANFIGISASAILSGSLINRLKSRTSFLYYWMAAGIFLSLFPLAANITVFPIMALFVTLTGIYFGLGMPICFGYFASITEASNRARLGGMAFLTIFLGFFLLTAIGITSIELNSFTLSLWKVGGLALLLFIRPDDKEINRTDKISYISMLKTRPFFLYFIPWIMFSVVNSLAPLIIPNLFTKGLYQTGSALENIIAAMLALIFGFFADVVGRKRLVVTGFTVLGLGYASLGLFPGNNVGSWFYFISDGVAWGVFYTIFILTLWGDLAHERNSEKFYAIGSLPYIFSNFIRITASSTGSSIVPDSAIFSFASLFIFLAVLPLVYAPETLSEKLMKDRELKDYLEKAQKIVQKEAQKNLRKHSKTVQDATYGNENEELVVCLPEELEAERPAE